MSQVNPGQKRRLYNSLHICVDHWNRWDRALFVQILNLLLSKSKCKKNIWPVTRAAMSWITINRLLSWKLCVASSPRVPCRVLGLSMRLMLLRTGPEVVHEESSGRRIKPVMSLSGFWDVFSYLLRKKELRSPLGRSRDGIWVPSLSANSLAAQPASPA